MPSKEGRGRGHTEQSEGTGGRVGNVEGGEVPIMGAMAQLLKHKHQGCGLSIDTDTSALPRAQYLSLPGSCAEGYEQQERKRGSKTQPLTLNVGGLAGDGSRGWGRGRCAVTGEAGKGRAMRKRKMARRSQGLKWEKHPSGPRRPPARPLQREQTSPVVTDRGICNNGSEILATLGSGRQH